MGIEDIKKMYDAMENSKIQDFEKAKNKSLADLQAREEQNKNTFYKQRDDVAYNSAKNTQQIRDYMAKNNLMQSGESVDALLRNNTDYSNRMGNVDANEVTFRNDIARERNLVNRNYENDTNALRSQIEMEKIKAINDYNERLRQEQLAAQQAAYKASSARSSSKSSDRVSKNDLKAQFMELVKSKEGNSQARDFMDNGKDQIINEYGYAFYKELEDAYWKDMGDYYARKA